MKGPLEDFFCFVCGARLPEEVPGFCECEKCGNVFLPFMSKEGFQCLELMPGDRPGEIENQQDL